MYRPHVTTSVATLALLAHVACSSSPGTDPTMMENAEGGGASDPGTSSSSGGSLPQGAADAAWADAGSTSQSADGGASPSSHEGGAADGGASPSSHEGGAGATASDAGSSNSEGGAGGNALPPATAAVVMSTFTVNQAGRTGADLVFTVTGKESDLAEGPFGLDLRLEDASGNPVLAFTDWARDKTGERVVLFDNASAAGLATFTETVTLAGYYQAFPSVAQVIGSIVTQTGVSNAMVANVTKQAFVTSGQSCDPNVLLNRCGLGLACIGKTPVCTAGVAPQIAKFSYFKGTNGPRLLIAGTDPADDLSLLHLAFLDASGHPVLVDMTGNGDYANSYDVDASSLSLLGAFFDDIQAAPMFDSTVIKLVATPIGASTGSGTPVTATIATEPLSATGKSCDARGFSGCVAGDACVAGSCVTIAAAEAAAATAAPLLDPSAPTILATGYTSSLSLWGDPPQGCMPQGIHAFPQGIVHLHLAQSASTLTLTAGNSETNFQNGLFVLDGTGSQVTGTPLGCNGSSPSSLTLKNLSAGDYTVVVNSRDTVGGEFGVSVE
jgi:hypothetical protein